MATLKGVADPRPTQFVHIHAKRYSFDWTTQKRKIGHHLSPHAINRSAKIFTSNAVCLLIGPRAGEIKFDHAFPNAGNRLGISGRRELESLTATKYEMQFKLLGPLRLD